MEVTFDYNGYVENYAIVGGLDNGIEVSDFEGEELEKFENNHNAYKLSEDGMSLILDENKFNEINLEKIRGFQTITQNYNNESLARYLASHPITWTDGKQYGVTQEDQQEISLNLMQYQIAVAAGLSPTLEWHAIHEQCREFTQEELSALALAISEYVYPLVRKNQEYKTQIYAAKSISQLEEMVFNYEE